MSEEFYVGYLAKAPDSLAKWIKRAVAALLAGVLTAGVVLIFDQPPFATSRFEYGAFREFQGVIAEWPYPTLQTATRSFLLVAPGKHGFSEAAAFDGKAVRLQGSLIGRAGDQMLEIRPASLRESSPLAIQRPAAISFGTVRLRGEIVDTKCYLGVMNPGNGKVHRDCAARCISGGAPPALIARDASGETQLLLLVRSDGRRLSREVLPFVAEPIEVAGELVRAGSNLVLKAGPAGFRRNPE